MDGNRPGEKPASFVFPFTGYSAPLSVLAMLRFLESKTGRALRALFSLGLLAWFVLAIDWRELNAASGKFAWGPTLAATLLAGLAYPLLAWRWWLLLRAQAVPLDGTWAHRLTWAGVFYSSFLPGGIGGDAVRAWAVCRDAPQQRAGGLAATAIDRGMGLVMLVVTAALALGVRSEAWMRDAQLRGLFLAAAGLSLAAFAAAVSLLVVPPERWPRSLAQWLGERRWALVADLLRRIRTTPGAHIAALALSIVIWFFDFVAIWWLALAVELPLPFLETCIAGCVAYAATVLPVSLGGHGVREGALLATLGLFGLVPAHGPLHERALLLAVLVWAVTVFWSLVGGLVVLLDRRTRPASQ